MGATRVVVLGAGIIGAACARELALAGLAVTVVERGAPAAATTAHGEGNVLVSDKGPGPELDLALLSRRLWPGVLDAVAAHLPEAAAAVEWEPKGGIVVATTAAWGPRAGALRRRAARGRRHRRAPRRRRARRGRAPPHPRLRPRRPLPRRRAGAARWHRDRAARGRAARRRPARGLRGARRRHRSAAGSPPSAPPPGRSAPTPS